MMIRVRMGVLGCVFLCGGLLGCSQSVESAPSSNALSSYQDFADSVIRESLTQGESYRKLTELCETAPHRLSGSEGARAAVAWAKKAMIRDGLENVRLESVIVPYWVRGEKESLSIAAPEDARGLEFEILALGGSIATPPEGITAEVVEVQNFDELKELGDAAKGKIIFFNRPLDPAQTNTFAAYGGAVDQRGRGATEASKAGGVAAIVRSMTTVIDDEPHTGSMRYSEEVPKVPAAAISTLGAEGLSSLLAKNPGLKLQLVLSCETLENQESHNVVGEIVGSSLPDEIVVLGGHLDAWDVGQGAHDDGSGCVHVMEAARLIKQSGLKPRRTIRVVLFMNEENGVRGGNGYYGTHLDDMENHVFALESDRGGFTPRGFSTDANPAALSVLREIGGLLSSIGASPVDPGYGGVDISPMRKSGVITMGFVPDGQRYFDFHHSRKDVLSAVNERELSMGSAAIAAMVGIVADLPQRLPRNKPPTN